MKISASIYSDKRRDLRTVIDDLVAHQVDLLHVDCNDDPAVFEDIKKIRNWCDTPIDLHIITEQPSKYFDLLRAVPVEYVTFQYENSKETITFPRDIKGKKGLAIITPTSVDVFKQYEGFDFILIMATIPGQSGGHFDTYNFSKIRSFRKRFPGKSIHVDGGVNAEVSFILRNMGVSSAVSGSYLFNAESVGNALMNLTKREVDSHYRIKDFMIPMEECPKVSMSNLNLEIVLKSIETGQLGFTLVTDDSSKFLGLISNADIRKGLLRNLNNLNELEMNTFVNEHPVSILEEATVVEMLGIIKTCNFPIMYIPVVDKNGFARGIVTFVNLIKGEL